MSLEQRVQKMLSLGRTPQQIRAVAVARDDKDMRLFAEKMIRGEVVVSADVVSVSADEAPSADEGGKS